MRFVPANCLREGMRVARTLYGKNNEKLLIAGVELSKKNIDSIQRKKFPGLYIDDDLSRDISVISTISDELRMETAKGVKKIFTEAKDRGDPKAKIVGIMQQVDGIVDELLANRYMMVNMIDLKCYDNYTYLHSVNVAVLSIVTGIAMGLDRDTLSRLGLSAILHDIGKVFINKKIINKPGILTPEEFEEVKKHSQLGYDYARNKFRLQSVIYTGIIDHHEKYDGSGYPNGKCGGEISLFGKIIAVADVYDALTSERPYRKAQSPSEAMEYVLGGVESIFDPRVSTIFIRKVAPYPIGTTVRLSNGYTAIVLENFEEVCMRPRVRVIKAGGEDVMPFELNLMTDYNLLSIVIEGIVNDNSAF
ncbi:HD-GYP domain, c-di-GMP phosphodiesterase class II (or its inactivated variant) [Sporobacter termitidis DSM 10068]|uniref:HD-GYP domain, c-di-GMP phosphodiesterase class II (Or its inactivated variant) n=1 Tax=Sporobacter termitidis DSM 10068 TaxID=1123282 RepID=A0A1M5YL07_9FIRM|nr:HD-GYP domain-containing protein [Sporobacter termitidis]SHI12747.1 HD-GYP domain, c-di-GMP phosphodiesterase class II (or its inactivated variant) [Sporobacter termitidis DSM 10068]